MSTPWGAVQYAKNITRGVSVVSTARHGGLRISKAFAEKHLSVAAISRATVLGNYLYYEEDCDMAIPAFELEKYHETLYGENAKEKLLKSLSLWNLDYLEERGITPNEEAAKKYRAYQKTEEMRKNNHPDLIVFAIRTDQPGITKVGTADGNKHFVKSDSYDSTRELNLLSYCELAQ